MDLPAEGALQPLFQDRRSAKADGLPTYFLGHRCLSGHQAPKRVSDGKCTECVAAERARAQEKARALRLKATAPQRAKKDAERRTRETLKQEAKEAKREARGQQGKLGHRPAQRPRLRPPGHARRRRRFLRMPLRLPCWTSLGTSNQIAPPGIDQEAGRACCPSRLLAPNLLGQTASSHRFRSCTSAPITQRTRSYASHSS